MIDIKALRESILKIEEQGPCKCGEACFYSARLFDEFLEQSSSRDAEFHCIAGWYLYFTGRKLNWESGTYINSLTCTPSLSTMEKKILRRLQKIHDKHIVGPNQFIAAIGHDRYLVSLLVEIGCDYNKNL